MSIKHKIKIKDKSVFNDKTIRNDYKSGGAYKAMLQLYNQAYEAYTKKKFDKPPEYIMSALWINYQKANEFNPPHDHDGKLSLVIYLKIPEELKKENKEYKGRSCGPGGIQFMYGEGPRDAVTYMSHFPEERYVYLSCMVKTLGEPV